MRHWQPPEQKLTGEQLLCGGCGSPWVEIEPKAPGQLTYAPTMPTCRCNLGYDQEAAASLHMFSVLALYGSAVPEGYVGWDGLDDTEGDGSEPEAGAPDGEEVR